MAVQRRTAAADQRQAGQQQGHEHQALVCVRRVHAGHRQDCCLNSCWTPSEERLAPLEVSSALNRNLRSEEHTSGLQSLMRISYAVFCLKKQIKRYLITV